MKHALLVVAFFLCSCLYPCVNSQAVCPWGSSIACCFSSSQSGTCSSSQIAQLLAAGGNSGDNMGWSSAISGDGNTAIVGAYVVSTLKGEAYIFVKSGISWIQTATLTVSTGAILDQFGYSVGISSDGSTVIVSALGISSYKGAAYIFVKSGASWTTTSTPTATLTVSGGANNDNFGFIVGISSDGSTVIVGAYGVSSFKGAAYIFVKGGAPWTTTSTPTATLTFSGGSFSDAFGSSVGISSDGSTAIVGAYGVSGGAKKGAAYIFAKNGASWTTTSTPTATLTVSGGFNDDLFGSSVGISSDGSTVIVGALGISSYKGAAYIFIKSGASWTTTSTPTATLTVSGGANSDRFGTSVGISSDGSTVIVGAPFVSTDTGSAYIFIKSGASWTTTSTPTATLTASGGSINDRFGISVGISSDGSTVIVGAPGVSSGKGAAYIFGAACGSAVTCGVGGTCVVDSCACTPSCTGKLCGADDGCGGKCFIPCTSAVQFIPVPTAPISFQSSTTFIFTVQVSIVGSAVETPTGTVTVVEVTKNTLICQATLTPTAAIGIAQGSCSIVIPQGNWAFDAKYNGNSVFGTSSAEIHPALQSNTFQVPGGSTATINNVNTQLNQDINPGGSTFKIKF